MFMLPFSVYADPATRQKQQHSFQIFAGRLSFVNIYITWKVNNAPTGSDSRFKCVFCLLYVYVYVYTNTYTKNMFNLKAINNMEK